MLYLIRFRRYRTKRKGGNFMTHSGSWVKSTGRGIVLKLGGGSINCPTFSLSTSFRMEGLTRTAARRASNPRLRNREVCSHRTESNAVSTELRDLVNTIPIHMRQNILHVKAMHMCTYWICYTIIFQTIAVGYMFCVVYCNGVSPTDFKVDG